MHTLRIARAEKDLLFDDTGREFVDLFTGNGAAWLGHGNPAVTAALTEQLDRVWITGGLPTAIGDAARAAVESFFPSTHRLAALYSTGMESAEFALRIARVSTGRTGVIGFNRGMHGKSLATAILGWDNRDGASVPFLHRLPFVPNASESDILNQVANLLTGGAIGAVFVEPIQGSGGGHAASSVFYRDLAARCAEHGALLVFDEILTGFHRTGPAFVFSDLGITPDVILVGKAMGNGFPVSGVMVNRRIEIVPAMLAGSTFAGNPLAAAAVASVLGQMRMLDLAALARAIDSSVREILDPLRTIGVVVRGRGALWVLELPPEPDPTAVVVDIFRSGVAVGTTGRLIRLLPAATIDPGRLRRALTVVRDRVTEAYR